MSAPGRFGGAPFTKGEDDELIRLREAERLSWGAIAQKMGRPSGACCRARYDKIKARQVERERVAARQKGAKERGCMTCGAPFLSAHAGNRMCVDCRGISVSPFAPEGDGLSIGRAIRREMQERFRQVDGVGNRVPRA